MKKFQHYFFLIILLFTFSTAFSQDPQFSQFAATPHQTNPALIGVYDGSMRIAMGYREQWGTVLGNTPFRTVTGSVDFRRPVLKGDFVGVGVTVLHDEAHESKFSQDRAHVGVSYMKQVGGSGYKSSSQYLIAAGQFGYGQNSFDNPNLWFSDQFDEVTTSISNPTGENFDNQISPMYMDINAGLLWYGVFDKNRSIYAGGAIHHINKPDVSFFEGGDKELAQRYTAQLGGEFPIATNLTLLPAALGVMQNKSLRIIGGTHMRYSSREWKEIALRMGLWANVANKLESGLLMDAMIVTATLETERLDFGLSYDLNTSGLSQVTNSRGAFEIMLTYKQPSKDRKLRVNCPRF